MAKKKENLIDKAGWLLGTAGMIMVVIGFLLLFTPGMAIETAVLLIGAAFVVGGALKLSEAIFACKDTNLAASFAIGGACMVAVGLIMLFGSEFVVGGVILMFGALAALLAIVAIIGGIGQIAYGMKLKKGGINIIIGLALILLGIVMLFNILGSAVALIMVLGMFMIVYGIAMMVLALNIKKMIY